MARAWVTDTWTTSASVTLPDGTTTKVSPTPAQLKSLNSLPEHFRTARFGRGLRWRAGWYDDNNAQRTRGFRTKAEADAFAAELEDDIRSGRYIDPSLQDRRFREAAEIWLQSKTATKASTRLRYQRELRTYVLPKWGHVRIGAIKREAITAWVRELQTATAPFDFDPRCTKKKPQPLAPSYIRHLVGKTFAGVMKYTVDEHWIGRNPLNGVELPRIQIDTEEDLPSLTCEEVETLADAAMAVTGRLDDRALAHMQMYAGPRIGESTAFKVKDFDAAGKRIRVRRTWTLDDDALRVIGPPKGHEKRWVPLPQFLVDELVQLCENRGPEDWLFQSSRGVAIDSSNWYNHVWKKMQKSTGLATGYSVHDLRHVAATLAIAFGADVKLVQKMLGHVDATETLNTYSSLWPDKIDEVARAIEVRRAEAMLSRAT